MVKQIRSKSKNQLGYLHLYLNVLFNLYNKETQVISKIHITLEYFI